MTHDPLCPMGNPSLNWVACDWCDLIVKVREDERSLAYAKAAASVREYADQTHEPHAPDWGCRRCDITAALLVAATEIDDLVKERTAGFVMCPTCGGKGEVRTAPYGEPDSCMGCRGTGEVPEYVFDYPEPEWEPDLA